jgi:hypothetical protein
LATLFVALLLTAYWLLELNPKPMVWWEPNTVSYSISAEEYLSVSLPKPKRTPGDFQVEVTLDKKPYWLQFEPEKLKIEGKPPEVETYKLTFRAKVNGKTESRLTYNLEITPKPPRAPGAPTPPGHPDAGEIGTILGGTKPKGKKPNR